MDAETRIERFLDALRMHLSDSTDATEAFHIRECLTLAEDILDPQPHRVADPESYAARQQATVERGRGGRARPVVRTV